MLRSVIRKTSEGTVVTPMLGAAAAPDTAIAVPRFRCPSSVLERGGRTVAGLRAARVALAEDEEAGVASAQARVPGAVEVERGVDQVIGGLRSGAVQVGELLAVVGLDLVIGRDAEQEDAAQPIAVEAVG